MARKRGGGGLSVHDWERKWIIDIVGCFLITLGVVVVIVVHLVVRGRRLQLSFWS